MAGSGGGTITSGRYGPQYKAWQLAVFLRDGFKCLKCGKRGKKNSSGMFGIQAHHIKKWADAPELRYNLYNGITLCYKCHKNIWQREESYQSLCYLLLAKNNMKMKLGRVIYPKEEE